MLKICMTDPYRQGAVLFIGIKIHDYFRYVQTCKAYEINSYVESLSHRSNHDFVWVDGVNYAQEICVHKEK